MSQRTKGRHQMIRTLTGTNSFMLKSELNSLVNQFVSEHSDLALEKFDGEDTSAERMIEAVQSLPFLVNKKLIVLRNPSVQKAFIEAIERVIKAVPDSTDLIIVEPKLDKRSAYFKVLKAQTEYTEFNEQEANNLSKWIVQYVKERGGSISQVDAKYLIERVGQKQLLLANELDKMMVYDTQVTKQTIDLLTEPTPQSTVFELLDAAFAGDIKKTLKLYKDQRALKIEPQQIVAMLAWQLHVLAVVKSAGQRTADQIAKEARLNPYVVRKTMNIARNRTLGEVKELVSRALELDVRLKTQIIDADEALMHFLITIS